MIKHRRTQRARASRPRKFWQKLPFAGFHMSKRCEVNRNACVVDFCPQGTLTRMVHTSWPVMKLFVAGLSYKTAPVEVREQIAVTPGKLRCCSCRLKIAGELSEVVLLSTCNRVEIYGVTSRLNGRLDALFQLLTGKDLDLRPYLYTHEGTDAVAHLFSVASGLDSMVLGETEITGQVKQAYQTAHEARL